MRKAVSDHRRLYAERRYLLEWLISTRKLRFAGHSQLSYPKITPTRMMLIVQLRIYGFQGRIQSSISAEFR